MGLEALVGARASPSIDAPDGSVAAQALTFRLGATVTLTSPSTRPAFGVTGAIGVHALRFVAEPAPGAQAASQGSAALTRQLGPTLLVPLGDRGATLLLAGAVAEAGSTRRSRRPPGWPSEAPRGSTDAAGNASVS